MFTAYVACIDIREGLPISGNGKTLSMVGVAYLNKIKYKKTIWSNFETDFSDEVMGLQEMMDTIGDKPHPNLEILITEMGKLINSLGTKTKKALYIENMARESRKREFNLSYDEQRFMSVNNRLRNFTDNIFIPVKYHFDGTPCKYNLCKKPHKIYLYSYEPPRDNHLLIFDACKVGAHYNSKELAIDKLRIDEIKEVD